jgi:transposase
MPSSDGKRGRPWRDHRQVLEGIIYRFRTGIAWRDLPDSFGPWQTVWERHQLFGVNGTYDKIHARLLPEADAVGDIDWMISVDSTINRAHQHATNATRAEQLAGDTYAARRARSTARVVDRVVDRAGAHTGG